MPFDQANYPDTKTAVFSLEGVIEWLRGEDLDTEYCWVLGGHCLWANYGKAMGLGGAGGSPYLEVMDGFGHGRNERSGEPFNHLASTPPHTYRAAIAKAKGDER